MSCPHCDGARWRVVTDGGVPRAERCVCWRADAGRTLLAAARIPPRYRDCDLTSFVTYDNPRLDRALDRTRRFVEAFPVVEKGLLLMGPPGIGKTHIAVAALRQVVSEKRAHGLYYDTRSLLATIRRSYDPVTRGSEGDVLRPVVEAELLVLDDLGAERLTDWVDETMNYIVNTRYNDRLATIFTSNYEDPDDEHPDDEDPDPEKGAAPTVRDRFGRVGAASHGAARASIDSLLERVGFRMHSRLREMCEFLEYDGPDYRDFEFAPSSEDLGGAWKKKKSQRKLPARTTSRARARLKTGEVDLAWPGGRAGR